MVATKKTRIRIKNMDDPEVRKASQNKKSTFDFDDDFDVVKDMHHRLAGADAENRIDLNDEEGLKKKKKEPKLDPEIDLSDEAEDESEMSEVAARMHSRFKAMLGGSEESDKEEKTKPEENKAAEVEKKDKVKKAKIEKKSKKDRKEEVDETEDIDEEMLEASEEAESHKVVDEVAKVEKHRVSLKMYRNIAAFFVLGTLVMLSAVFYFTAVKLTINVTPKKEIVNEIMSFNVVDSSRDTTSMDINTVAGVVEATTVSKTQKFPSTGEKVVGEDAIGKVTLYNNYVKNQPLVATTRLLSSDGKLFRLKETVNVPAGGAVEADIYADQPEPNLEVAPSRFTIPGLWAGIQDKIYAESKETIKFQQQTERYVQINDIDNAIATLKQTLPLEAKDQIGATYSSYKKVLYKVDDGSITSIASVKAGDKAEEFEVTIKASVGVAAFNDTDIIKMAKEKLITSIPANKELTDFDEQSAYNLDSIDLVQKTASINANFSGMAMINSNANVIDRDKIVGINEKQLRSYLSNIKEISEYNLVFYPSWLKQVPKLVDRITVNVVK